MTNKEKVCEWLESHRGVYLSGKELAQDLGVSRAAVWKMVEALREEGWPIEAAPNRGYRLLADADLLTQRGVERYLTGAARQLQVEVYDQVSSTNTVLRERAEAGAPEGLAVAVMSQTAGRGRMGRSFFSPVDTGVYLSLLLRPQIAPEQAIRITTAAAVAVCLAIEKVTGKEAGIKWVNDVYLNGKKICGILAEAAFGMETGRLDYAVLGIGVNMYAPRGGFPPELEPVAGCVQEARLPDGRNRLTAEILNAFMEIYPRLEQGGFLEEYRKRSLALDRQVWVQKPEGPVPALAYGLDEDCRLLVRYGDGTEEALTFGEIRIKL